MSDISEIYVSKHVNIWLMYLISLKYQRKVIYILKGVICHNNQKNLSKMRIEQDNSF